MKKEWTTPRVYTLELHPADLKDPVIREWFETGYNDAKTGLAKRDYLEPFSNESIAYEVGYDFFFQAHPAVAAV